MDKVRKIMPYAGAVLALAAIILVCCANIRVVSGANNYFTLNGYAFGVKTVTNHLGPYVTEAEVPGELAGGAAILPLIGFILMIIGTVCVVTLSLVGDKIIPSANLRKIILISAAGLVLVGAIFEFFAVRSYAAAVARNYREAGLETTTADILSLLKGFGKTSAPLGVTAGILGLVGALAMGVPQLFPED